MLKDRVLRRFLEAQNLGIGKEGTVYDLAVKELADGKKKEHWIWFIFPQRKGLGKSKMSQYYGLTRFEAWCYRRHPVLKPRWDFCVALVEAQKTHGKTPEDVLGKLDAMKYESSRELLG